MRNDTNMDVLVGYLRAIAFYLGKARQEVETLKDKLPKKQTEEEKEGGSNEQQSEPEGSG